MERPVSNFPDTKEYHLKKIQMDMEILARYSELLYTRKPKATRQISKKKVSIEKNVPFEKELHQDESQDIESQALAILNEDDEDNQEIDELMDYLKGKSKERMQKAKIFYKNLKFNFNLLEIYHSDDEQSQDDTNDKNKKKIKRVKSRVITDVFDKYKEENKC